MKHSEFLVPLDIHCFDQAHAILSKGIDNQEKQQQLSDALMAVLRAYNESDTRPSAVEVSAILQQLNVDADTLIATLLSDPRLRESFDHEQVEAQYGKAIANIVSHIHWLNTFKDCSVEVPEAPEEAETLRRMLLATVDDIRAVLAKLAYRIQRLRGLPNESEAVRRCIARETQDVYVPLVNRLGIAQLKWEMEDFAFRYLEPESYMRLAKSIEGNRLARESYIEEFARQLNDEVAKIGVTAEISGRAKHLYSAWKKMQRKQVEVDEVADLLAVRVIVDTIPQCYMVLGMAHHLWKHLPHEFDDYIANSKGNGYQSIHTAVIGSDGRVVEIQIRTREMQEFAENGVAAHWRYKEGSQQDKAMEQTIVELRRLLENMDDSEGFLEDFHAELFSEQVYVMSPKGDVVTLIQGATPVDFAYAIHTEVGHCCRGARINGRVVPLTHILHSGERVEVITSEQAKPSREWLDPRLGYLKTPRARAKVRHWFNHQTTEAQRALGQRIYASEMQRLGIQRVNEKALLDHFYYADMQALWQALGSMQLSNTQLVKTLDGFGANPSIPSLAEAESLPFSIIGVGQLETRIADCCKPVVGDSIVGWLTEDQVVVIHRHDCKQWLGLADSDQKRTIEVQWGHEGYNGKVRIHIDAFDRKRLLSDVTEILTQAGINMLEVNTRTDTDNQSVTMDLLIEVMEAEQLSLVLDKMNVLPNVFLAKRSD